MGRSQLGNNNAYCQDNELSWVDWDSPEHDQALIAFTCALSQLRRQHPVFRRRRFFSGLPTAGGAGLDDIIWLTPSGQEMTEDDWQAQYARSLAVFLNGGAITEPGPHGEQIRDHDFVLLFNAHSEPVTFTLPGERFEDIWEVVVDTAAPGGAEVRRDSPRLGAPGQPAGPGAGRRPATLTVAVDGRSIMVLRSVAMAAPR
jgi:glycogen operon protein